MSWSIRTESAFEGMPNSGDYRVANPTLDQYQEMLYELTHGESAFAARYPELPDVFDWAEFSFLHYEVLTERCLFDMSEVPKYRVRNIIGEELSGPMLASRDLIELLARAELWHEKDHKYLDRIQVTPDGCWQMPAYLDTIKPKRARYPQVRTFSATHGDIRQQMGPAWMWERVIGPFPTYALPSGKRGIWPDHRCQNKNCVYPRHAVIGTPRANDAFTERAGIVTMYHEWMNERWARPSPVFSDGIIDLAERSEFVILSDRAVITPIHISRAEFDQLIPMLRKSRYLPDGHYTSDPGYHVLKSASNAEITFDEVSGCWNTTLDLRRVAPHASIVHQCGSATCCNIRHMDVHPAQRKFFEVVESDYVTLPNGNVMHRETGEDLGSYWQSWLLFWNWLRANSEHEPYEYAGEHDAILTYADYKKVWVHPITGCWENDGFYPRWTSKGVQQNSYGYVNRKDGNRTNMHRHIYFAYLDYFGERVTDENKKLLDIDHRCQNRRCFCPFHLQPLIRTRHAAVGSERRRYRIKNSGAIVPVKGGV